MITTSYTSNLPIGSVLVSSIDKTTMSGKIHQNNGVDLMGVIRFIAFIERRYPKLSEVDKAFYTAASLESGFRLRLYQVGEESI